MRLRKTRQHGCLIYMKFLPSIGPVARFRSFLVSAITAVAVSSCATSVPIGKKVPVSEGEGIRASLREASRVMVYEGLPHQTKEKELMEREAARKGTIRILGYPFYTPSVPAKDREALQRILGDARTYAPYSGPKTCGGFHPDYNVSWSSAGTDHHIQICFGCGEALLTDGRLLLAYDVKHTTLAELRSLLARHALKRPPVVTR